MNNKKNRFYLFKKVGWKECVMTIVGVFFGLGGVAFIGFFIEQPLLIAPFGASCVLLYGAPTSPLAQPRNFIGSYIVSGLIAITCVNLFGNEWYMYPIIVVLSILAMMVTDTVHPPGGACALLIVLQGTTNYLFLLNPIAIGLAIMLVSAILSSKIFPGVRPYPAKRKDEEEKS